MTDRQRAFEEVGHKCARCGNYEAETLSIDHIDSNHSNSRYDNLIILCHNCHHMKTQNKGVSLEEIRLLKASLIRKTLTEYGINALKLCSRKSFGAIAMPFLVEHLVDMGYLKRREVQMSYGGKTEGIDVTVRYEISEKGKGFYGRWKSYF